MKAYYARPISIDGTPQQIRDELLLIALGYEVTPTAEEKVEILKQYKEIGMSAFKSAVQNADCFVFRSFPDGSIGAGVFKEILWALDKGIPVLEIPHQIGRRALSVDDTRDMLAELGQR